MRSSICWARGPGSEANATWNDSKIAGIIDKNPITKRVTVISPQIRVVKTHNVHFRIRLTELNRHAGSRTGQNPVLPDPAPLNGFFRDLILAPGRQDGTVRESEGRNQ
ncbi:MAG: hypothetical protein V2J10_12325 [Wenzhouxiangella sp.]|jgi:hypothetical protein|nr:hypothetical protein [Wenzhouxiangella sp.]